MGNNQAITRIVGKKGYGSLLKGLHITHVKGECIYNLTDFKFVEEEYEYELYCSVLIAYTKDGEIQGGAEGFATYSEEDNCMHLLGFSCEDSVDMLFLEDEKINKIRKCFYECINKHYSKELRGAGAKWDCNNYEDIEPPTIEPNPAALIHIIYEVEQELYKIKTTYAEKYFELKNDWSRLTEIVNYVMDDQNLFHVVFDNYMPNDMKYRRLVKKGDIETMLNPGTSIVPYEFLKSKVMSYYVN